ncbi:hypothetical protein BC833DRAFT_562401 [Globomyces pollinis-pini]|nr:hypothetical protein BC833DRAFT_562401 [Globomyces pollinis-pini]
MSNCDPASSNSPNSSLPGYSGLPSYGSEAIQLISMIYDPTITFDTFSNILSTMITSNLYLFEDLFGSHFKLWIDWMCETNNRRFLKFLNTCYVTEMSIYLDLLQLEGEQRALAKEIITSLDIVKSFLSHPNCSNTIMNYIYVSLKTRATFWIRPIGTLEILRILPDSCCAVELNPVAEDFRKQLHFESLKARIISRFIFEYMRMIFRQSSKSLAHNLRKEVIWTLIDTEIYKYLSTHQTECYNHP